MKASVILLTSFVAAGGANPLAANVQVAVESSGEKQFTLTQSHNKKFKGHNAQAELIRLHAKYGVKLPEALQKVVKNAPVLNSKFSALLNDGGNGSTGSSTAFTTEGYDSEYFVDVDIGTPAQKLPLNLDTGSSDLWVFSTDTYSSDVRGQALYDPTDSTTSKRLDGEKWQIQYGDGSGASGIVFQDKVSIGGVSAEKQGVQVAIDVAQSIADDPVISGILGMAASAGNMVEPTRQMTFFDNIVKTLKEPLFTANLQKGMPGTYNFGYINQSEYIGDIHYTPIDRTSPFWRITVDGYQIGHSGDYNKVAYRPIVDTGTSLLLLPESIVNKYYDQIKGSYFEPQLGMILYPCKATPPDFIFGIGDYRGVVPGNYVNYAPANKEYCYGGIQALDGAPFPVFGDILLKAQFTVFHRGNLTVGFANKKTVSD